jgi:hypothetical protein
VNLLKNLREIGKVPLQARIGGASQNDMYYLPEQKEALIGWFNGSTDYTYNVTIGPTFVESFKFWPNDTQWIVGLPFHNGTLHYVEQCKKIGKLVANALGKRLVALEIGNEWGGKSNSTYRCSHAYIGQIGIIRLTLIMSRFGSSMRTLLPNTFLEMLMRRFGL